MTTHSIFSPRLPSGGPSSFSPPRWGSIGLLVWGLLLLGTACQRGGAAPPAAVAPPPQAQIIQREAAASVVIRPVEPLGVGRLEPVPREVLAAPGETVPLTALVYDSQGAPILDATFRWRMADPTVGSVSPGGIFQAGMRLGSYPGAIVVEARSPRLGPTGFARAEVSVTIVPAGRTRTPVKVQVAPRQVEVRPGQSLFLVAYPVDEAGIPVPGVPVEWEVLDSRAGTLTVAGKFTAGQEPGIYPQALRARAGQGLVSEAVTVRILDPVLAPPRVQVSVLPTVATVLPNETLLFRVLVLDETGQQLPVLSTQWEVLTPQAGQISPTGRFKAGSQVGNYPEAVRATVRYRLEGREATATAIGGVVVIAPPQPPRPADTTALARVVIVPQRVEVYPGEAVALAVVNLDGNGLPIAEVPVEWRLDTPEAGSITPYGKVTAGFTPGVYTDAIRALVRVPTAQGERVVEGRATLVVRGPLERLQVIPPTVTVLPGQRVQFLAEGYDAFGTFLPGLRLRWRLEDTRAGTITEDGLFRAGSIPGSYPDAVRVEATQRYPVR
ncbi:MAG: hypothetical protein NZ951_07120 [Dehalococcoidia bacterium]|nr:hypothetical protein [Dehalococcoidia bacterium]MDW8120572.1 hypothetical protein [Chloroflexota bacterium]